MKYYLLQGGKKGDAVTFTMVRVSASDVAAFLKRNDGQILFEGASAAEVLAQLGGMLDKGTVSQ